MSTRFASFPAWMKIALLTAGAFNLAGGLTAVFFPALFFQGFDWPASHREFPQFLGVLVSALGVAFLAASTRPLAHWPVVLAGLFAKVFAPLLIAAGVWEGRYAAKILVLVSADVFWWAPFALILLHAYRERTRASRTASPDIQTWSLRAKSQYGLSILEHSRVRPVLLVFLRHLGCPFCREALSDLAAHRKEIEKSGAQLLLVHLSDDDAADRILARHGLSDVPRILDTTLALYAAFGLVPGTFSQLYGPKVFARGFQTVVLDRNGIGLPDGDIAQMPGVFLVFHGEILKAYRHQSVADRPNYVEMVEDIAGVPDIRTR